MKCPSCDKDLVQTKRDDIEVEYCPSCRGMWLSRQELEELEDEVFDFGDDEKGTLIFNATATGRKCPQCGKLMKRFNYRLYDLEMDFCEDGHGFWLDANKDKNLGADERGRDRSREKGFRRRPMGGRSPVYALRVLPRQNALAASSIPLSQRAISRSIPTAVAALAAIPSAGHSGCSAPTRWRW